ncbi:MAG: hypothetical protein Pars2KO_33310 [Parasphingorhabdus sp.]
MLLRKVAAFLKLNAKFSAVMMRDARDREFLAVQKRTTEIESSVRFPIVRSY